MGLQMIREKDKGQAMELVTELRGLSKNLNSKHARVSALLAISDVYHDQDRTDQALQMATEALEISERMNDTSGQAIAQHTIASLLMFTRPEKAKKAAEEAVSCFRCLGDRENTASALHLLASACLRAKGAPKEAALAAEKACEIYRALGSVKDQAITQHTAGHGYLASNQFEKALAAANEAVALFKQVDMKSQEANALNLIGNIHLMNNAPLDALQPAKAAVRMYRELGDDEGIKASKHTVDRVQELIVRGTQVAPQKSLQDVTGEPNLQQALGSQAYNCIIWARALTDGTMMSWNVDFCNLIVEVQKSPKKIPIIVPTRGVYGRQMGEISPPTITDMSAVSIYGLIRCARMELPNMIISCIDVSCQSLAADMIKGTKFLSDVNEIVVGGSSMKFPRQKEQDKEIQ